MTPTPASILELDPDEHVVFADDLAGTPSLDAEPWLVLLVDADEHAHTQLRAACEDLKLAQQPVRCLGAYTAAEARARLLDNPTIAVVVIDLAAPTPDGGLQLARAIREDLANSTVRIVLQADRPEATPRSDVLDRHEINDCVVRNRTTPTVLASAVMLALRHYREVRGRRRSQDGLLNILKAAGDLFHQDHDDRIAERIVDGLVGLLERAPGIRNLRCLLATELDGTFRVHAHRHGDDSLLGRPVAAALPVAAARLLPRVLADRRGVFCTGGYIDVLTADGTPRHLIYLEWDRLDGASERNLVRMFMANATLVFHNLTLNQAIIATQKEIIHTLSEVVETRSSETANHVLRVGLLARQLAELYGLPSAEVEILAMTAPMHDIGKVGIPDAILRKRGALTAAERRIIETHTSVGHSILSRSDRHILHAAAIIALQHHERWDGTGYPIRLRGEQIHPHARITALADVFDALLQPRCYRPALPVDEVIGIVAAERGRAFEPRLVDLLLTNLDRFMAIRREHPDRPADLATLPGPPVAQCLLG